MRRQEDIRTTRALALCATEAVIANLRTECGGGEWKPVYVPPLPGEVTRDPYEVEDALVHLLTNLYHFAAWHRLDMATALAEARRQVQLDIDTLEPA